MAHGDDAGNYLLAHTMLPDVEIYDTHDRTSLDSTSRGTVSAERLTEQALLRPADVLENIPGMVVTQHSGDGKANQYFLRGVNLDHGTDFATTVNGVPANLPTHAHGQGYSDLNFLMPELVQRVDFRKGLYAAQDGDFSSAGSANFVYRTHVDRPFSILTWGQAGYLRAIAADSRNLGEDLVWLGAVERVNQNGPWSVAEGLRKSNALFTLSSGTSVYGWSGSLSAYQAHWTATDQIPQRLIDQGSYRGQPFGRFDSLDPSDGGTTGRSSLSGEWHDHDPHQARKLSGYLMQYDLDLYSNFTYQINPLGDQFAQRDKRTVLGLHALQSWEVAGTHGNPSTFTVGLQMRQDQIRVGLDQTRQRDVTGAVRADEVTQSSIGMYAEQNKSWFTHFRTVMGIRLDQFHATLRDRLTRNSSWMQRSEQISPKFSAIWQHWQETEFFFHAGQGFHSNDVRSRTGLTRSRGEELGVRTQVLPNLESSLTLWRLRFDSELVYVGDTGTTEAGRPSLRSGVELTNQWRPSPVWTIDANLALSRPRYTDANPIGNAIPNAVQKIAQLNATAKNIGAWSLTLGMRYIGSAPLTEDNSLRSSSSISTQMRLTNRIDANLDVSLDVFNLTDRHNNDIQYAYLSHLSGETTASVMDYHIHPAEPRTWRLSARVKY